MTRFHLVRSRRSNWGTEISRAARSVIERLEGRTLLTAALQNGLLTIDGTGGNDQITLSVDASDKTLLDVNVNGVLEATPAAADVNQIQVNALDADDTLTVDVTNGNPIPAGGISYDGGNGFDSLAVTGSAAAATVYSPTAGGGTLAITSGGSTGTITAANIEPVLDTAPAGTLTVNGTAGNDSIAYTVGSTAANGMVAVNNFEPIEFSNKTTLIIDTGAGTDRVSFNNPNTPTGLTAITVRTNGNATADFSSASGPVTVFLGDNISSTNPNTVITGYAVPITLSGLTVANLDANGNSATVTGTAQNDNTIFTPTGATSGTFYDDIALGSNLVPNTIFNVSNVAGNLLVFNDPGGSADQVTIRGTAARDLFEINQASGIAQVLANNVTALLPVQLGISAEILNAEGLGGQNTFQVIPAPGIAGQAQDNMLVNLDGGATGASNALVVGSTFGNSPGNLPANELAVVSRSQTPDAGFVRVFTNAVANPDINYVNISTVVPLVGTPANLLVLGPDAYEPDDSQATAAFLGSGATVQIHGASIFPNSTANPGVPADQDSYQLVAQSTGTLDFQVAFKEYNPALLPGGGQLNLQVLDAVGNVVGSATGLAPANFGAIGAANARVRIPAVAGQSYYLRVFGATSNVINGYNATIVDTPAPTPTQVALASNATTTFSPTPTIYVHLDDGALLNDLPGNQTGGSALGIGPLVIPFDADTTISSTTPGYRIALYDDGSGTPTTGATHTLDPNDPTFIGFAQPVAGVPHEYSLTVGSQGADSLELGVHNIVARTQFIDPANPTASGFGAFSHAGPITVVNDSITSAAAVSITGKEGRLFSGTVATFTAANPAAPAGNFIATVNWGDGQSSAGTIVSDGSGKFHVTASHAYVEESHGSGYTMSVTINEIGANSATRTALAKIAESPLDQGVGVTNLHATKNVNTSLTLGSFRDQDSLNTHPGDFTGTIFWGDGSATSAASFAAAGSTFNVGSFWKVHGSHKYTKTGTFTIRIVVKHFSQSVTITSTIKVS